MGEVDVLFVLIPFRYLLLKKLPSVSVQHKNTHTHTHTHTHTDTHTHTHTHTHTVLHRHAIIQRGQTTHSDHLLPTPTSETPDNTNPPNTTQCQQQPYSGICLGPLLSCFSSSTVATSIQITSSVDIQTNEALASKIIVLLNSAYPSCLTGAHRFLCQYLFPLCDGNGTLYQPTYKECLNVSQGVCSVAWTQGPAAGVSLPVCLDLPNTTSICNGEMGEGEGRRGRRGYFIALCCCG